MNYSRIHVRTNWYDNGRRRHFVLYRFPFDRRVINDLKREIPGTERFWFPDLKAWVIGEEYRSKAEEIIRRHIVLGYCEGCLSNWDCRAWSHLAGVTNGSWDRDRGFQREPHRPSAEEQQRAQNAYQQWSGDRWSRSRTWMPPDDEFADTQFWGYRRVTPETKDRWQPPVRKPDTLWALRVLGLDKLPSAEELKKCYRQLAMEYHPDINHELNGDCTKMSLINMANDYLLSFLR